MIAKLTGILDSIGEDWIIIDVGGVGYMVFCSAQTLARLPKIYSSIALIIETHVREDHIHLFGFFDEGERNWFRMLLGVQGVGNKVALAILGILTPEQLLQVIAVQDKEAITRAPGVGMKLAVRILTELKDKAGTLTLKAVADTNRGRTAVSPSDETTIIFAKTSEAASALINLGYGRAEALDAVTSAARKLGEKPDVSALIKGGLAELAPVER